MTRHRSVKRILSFSSGVRKMFETAVAALLCAMTVLLGGAALLLDRAARGDDRLTGRCADLEAAHRDRLRQLAVGQHLHRSLTLHEARRAERIGCHLALEQRELVEPDDVRFLAERVGEAALRQPARERHLTALELRLAAARTVMARARLDALVSLARRLARARARPAAETLAVPVRARRGRQVVQAQLFGCHCAIPRRAPPRRGGAPS